MLSCRAVSRSDRYKDPGPPGGPNDFYTNMPTKKKTHTFYYHSVKGLCIRKSACGVNRI